MAAPNAPFTIGTFLNTVRALPGPDERVIRRSHTGLEIERWMLRQWTDPADTTDSTIVDVYLQLVRYYVNSRAGNILGPQGVYIAVPDVHVEPSAFYRGILDLPGGHILAAIDLQQAGLGTDVFRQIQYFFLPMCVQAHWSLVVISAVDRTVEILDSASTKFPNWDHRADNIYIKVFQFLEYILRPHFVPNQWRTMHTEAPQQRLADTHSCGYFVCRNAFRIACREPLDPQTYQNEYLWGQRCRVGAEVLRGRFTGPFNTHPIQPHPGPANRNVNAPWQPLNQSLLATRARRPREPWTKARLKILLKRVRAARGPGWIKGYTKWDASGKTALQMLGHIEKHFDKIYRGNFTP